jgi:hypothetical protein
VITIVALFLSTVLENVNIQKAKTILNANREEKLNDNQVKEILELLEDFARMSVEQFKNH